MDSTYDGENSLNQSQEKGLPVLLSVDKLWQES